MLCASVQPLTLYALFLMLMLLSLSLCNLLGYPKSSLFSLSVELQPNSTMPLEEGKGWKKKTTDIKENYDFKEVLGTWVFCEINQFGYSST